MSTIFNSEAFPAIITVLGSVITVSITYYKIEKMKLFETYFSNKARTYEDFWNAASRYNSFQTEENKVHLRTAVYCLGLYSSPRVFNSIIKLTDKLLNDIVDPESYVLEVMDLMREDLNNCKKYKFF